MPGIKKMQGTSPLKLRLVILTPKVGTLIDVFGRIADDFGLRPVGEPRHAKLESAFYRVEYDEYPIQDGRSKILSYEDNLSGLTIRDDINRKWLVYRSLTPYFEDNYNLLERTRTRIANRIIEGSKNWPQGDEKRTSVHKQVSWENSKDVYRFLRAYIKERLKTS